MKQYIVLFLMMFSNTLIAPVSPNVTNKKAPYENIETLARIQEENRIDSLDVKYMSTLRIQSKHKFNKEERKKLRNIANELGIKTRWLYKIMWIESRLNPTVVNKESGATGLIQWIPSSAIACGTTTEKLKNMSVLDQLDYVHTYFKLAANGKKINSYTDLYLLVFSPNAVGKSDSYIIGHKNSIIVKQNKGFMNSDSMITKKDIKLIIADVLM